MLLSHLRGVSLVGVTAICFLAGCAGVPTESTENTESTARAESVADKPATQESTASTGSSSSSSSAIAASEPRSSWREGRSTESRTSANEPRSEAKRSTASASVRESSSGDSTLVAQLNEASRELATLRAANARLRAERPAAATSTRVSESAARSDPMDDKIAASLKSYASLKQELAGFLAEIERGRAENAAASAKLKDAMSRSDDSRAAISRLESELRAEKRARTEAEQAAAKLQEQLRTIARALAAAGLSVDKLAAGAESGGRSPR